MKNSRIVKFRTSLGNKDIKDKKMGLDVLLKVLTVCCLNCSRLFEDSICVAVMAISFYPIKFLTYP